MGESLAWIRLLGSADDPALRINATWFNHSVINFSVACREALEEAWLISVIALHLVAGTVAGSIFTVRALFVLVGVILAECVAAAGWIGSGAALCCVGSLVAVQVGYLAGIFLRAVLEHKKIARPSIRPHHQR